MKRGGDGLWRKIAEQVLARVEVVAFGPGEALVAGDLLAQLEAAGQPIGIEDVFIGATALTHEAAIVTRNLRHLTRIPGLVVIDWWR